MKNTMTTYDYLNNAEQQLRNALKSSVDKSEAYQLKRIAEVIGTVSQIKTKFSSETPFTFSFLSENVEDYYHNNAADTISMGDCIVGSTGTDTITFR